MTAEWIPPNAEAGGGGRQRIRRQRQPAEDTVNSQRKATMTPSTKNSMAVVAVRDGNGPDEGADVRLRPMATSFMMKKLTEDKQGRKKIARSVMWKIKGERGTNPNPNL
jgi:hypothetical protein